MKKPRLLLADVMKVKPRSVAFHKYRAMEELGFKTTAELIQFASKTIWLRTDVAISTETARTRPRIWIVSRKRWRESSARESTWAGAS
jgi:hypothetical protein